MQSIYLQRALNELEAARVLKEISDSKTKKELLELKEERTFYNNSISCAYYSIFYSAKRYLQSKNIHIKAPHEHQKVYEALKELTRNGELDKELLLSYKKMIIRAEELLGIYYQEKNKRGKFTYHKLSESNKEIAEESIRHAQTFFKHIQIILEK